MTIQLHQRVQAHASHHRVDPGILLVDQHFTPDLGRHIFQARHQAVRGNLDQGQRVMDGLRLATCTRRQRNPVAFQQHAFPVREFGGPFVQVGDERIERIKQVVECVTLSRQRHQQLHAHWIDQLDLAIELSLYQPYLGLVQVLHQVFILWLLERLGEAAA